MEKSSVISLTILFIVNKEEKCKTRLVHGFHFWKATAGLTEPLKSAPKFSAADRLISAKNSDCTCAQ